MQKKKKSPNPSHQKGIKKTLIKHGTPNTKGNTPFLSSQNTHFPCKK
jgi:hypothetical protein